MLVGYCGGRETSVDDGDLAIGSGAYYWTIQDHPQGPTGFSTCRSLHFWFQGKFPTAGEAKVAQCRKGDTILQKKIFLIL